MTPTILDSKNAPYAVAQARADIDRVLASARNTLEQIALIDSRAAAKQTALIDQLDPIFTRAAEAQDVTTCHKLAAVARIYADTIAAALAAARDRTI